MLSAAVLGASPLWRVRSSLAPCWLRHAPASAFAHQTSQPAAAPAVEARRQGRDGARERVSGQLKGLLALASRLQACETPQRCRRAKRHSALPLPPLPQGHRRLQAAAPAGAGDGVLANGSLSVSYQSARTSDRAACREWFITNGTGQWRDDSTAPLPGPSVVDAGGVYFMLQWRQGRLADKSHT